MYWTLVHNTCVKKTRQRLSYMLTSTNTPSGSFNVYMHPMYRTLDRVKVCQIGIPSML